MDEIYIIFCLSPKVKFVGLGPFHYRIGSSHSKVLTYISTQIQ